MTLTIEDITPMNEEVMLASVGMMDLEVGMMLTQIGDLYGIYPSIT